MKAEREREGKHKCKKEEKKETLREKVQTFLASKESCRHWLQHHMQQITEACIWEPARKGTL